MVGYRIEGTGLLLCDLILAHLSERLIIAVSIVAQVWRLRVTYVLAGNLQVVGIVVAQPRQLLVGVVGGGDDSQHIVAASASSLFGRCVHSQFLAEVAEEVALQTRILLGAVDRMHSIDLVDMGYVATTSQAAYPAVVDNVVFSDKVTVKVLVGEIIIPENAIVGVPYCLASIVVVERIAVTIIDFVGR